jgi:hypothetical protein
MNDCELLLEAVSAIGLDKTLFGLHSLRSGGASQAANNNVIDRLFKAHGRWRSENANDGYVKDTLLSKLSVTIYQLLLHMVFTSRNGFPMQGPVAIILIS